jgi:hypothetical protein
MEDMMFNKTVLCLAVLILLATIGFNIYQYQRNKMLAVNTTQDTVTKENAEGAHKSTKVKNHDMKDLGKLEEKLDATEDELGKVNDQLSEELTKKKAFKAAQAQLQKNIKIDPSSKEAMKKMRLQSIDSDYALLYERLDLSPEELKRFKSIVATWRTDDMDTVDLILSASTDEQKAEAYRQRNLQREKYKEQYIELMGEEKYKIYNDYRMSRFDRDTLERFVQTLPPENRIDNDAMFNLIGRMSEARRSIEKKMGFYDLISFPSDKRGEEEAEREADMATQVYERYTEIGDEMLPPGQIEQFEAYIAMEKERYLSQLKIRSF